MATSANLALSARRNEACVRTLRFIGRDLTNSAMRMQVRLNRDTPGAPQIDLGTVADPAAEGLHFVKVETINYLPVSTVTLTLSKATMSDKTKVPYMGEVGDNGVYAYGLQIDGVTRLEGSFLALASAVDSDNAPDTRPVNYTSGSAGGQPWSGASLTFTNDDVTVSIDGYGQLAPLVAGVAADRQAVAALRQQTAADAGSAAGSALTAINARDAAAGSAGTATGAADRATGAATATAKDAATTGQNVATSTALRAQVQALVDQQTIRYYVDFTTGNDANDGLTAATAWKTGAPLAALGSAIAGKPIGIARGGRSAVPISLVSNQVRIRSYGDPALPPPLFLLSIDLPAWAPVAGQPNYWTASAKLYDDAKNVGNVFRNGVAVPLFFSVPETAAADYAATVSVWQVPGGNTQQTGTNAVVTIHSVTNPNLDGSSWRIANAFGLHVTGDDALIEGLRIDGPAHQDGGIAISGQRATIRNCTVLRTSRHAMLVGIGAAVEDCDLASGHRNDLEGGGGDALVVFYGPGVGGQSFATARTTFSSGIYGHSAIQGDALFGTVTSTDDTWTSQADTCLIGISSDYRVSRPTILGANVFFGGGSTGCKIRVSGMGSNGPSSLKTMCDLAHGEIFVSSANVFTAPVIRGGIYQCRAADDDPTISINGDTVTLGAADPAVLVHAVVYQQRGTLQVTGLMPILPGGRRLGSPTLDMIVAGFGGHNVTVSSTKNVWPFGSRFTINGTTYRSLAAAQAAGFEAGSTTTQPNPPIYTDTFDRADQVLETAGSGWAVLDSSNADGGAGTVGVRGNALTVLRADAVTAYAAGAAPTTDGYLRFTVAGTNWGAGLACIAVAGWQTFLGLRIENGSYVLYGSAAGALTKLGGGVAAPAAGDDVIVERHGTNLRVYVNGAVDIDLVADNPAYNAERRFGVIAWQGGTMLDNLRAGPL